MGEVVSFMGKIWETHGKTWENIEKYGNIYKKGEHTEDDGKSWDVGVKNFDENPEIVIA